MLKKLSLIFIVLCIVQLPTLIFAGESFKELIGDVQVGSVSEGGAIQVPFITWGGDVATFYANGGLTTKNGSIYNKMGTISYNRYGIIFKARAHS
jgi:hypothetical protein